MFEVSRFWLIVLNVLVILTIHLGISLALNRIPLKWFNPQHFLFRIRDFEKNPRFYTHKLKVKKWKTYIPDGARLFRSGFQKRALAGDSRQYLSTFMLETCRAELTHWLQMVPFFVFFLWNPWWSALAVCVYLFLANMPCILLQRHNRYRLLRVLDITR